MYMNQVHQFTYSIEFDWATGAYYFIKFNTVSVGVASTRWLGRTGWNCNFGFCCTFFWL